MDKLFAEVVDTYLKTKSTNRTSIIHSISRTKVRKILITMNVLSSCLIDDIKHLVDDGLSNDEICHKLHITRSIINENCGYSKGIYNGANRSSGAIRSERFHIKEAIYKERFKHLKEEKVYGKDIKDSRGIG